MKDSKALKASKALKTLKENLTELDRYRTRRENKARQWDRNHPRLFMPQGTTRLPAVLAVMEESVDTLIATINELQERLDAQEKIINDLAKEVAQKPRGQGDGKGKTRK